MHHFSIKDSFKIENLADIVTRLVGFCDECHMIFALEKTHIRGCKQKAWYLRVLAEPLRISIFRLGIEMADIWNICAESAQIEV